MADDVQIKLGNKVKPYTLLKEQMVKGRQPFDRDMLLNLSFFLDRQYTEWVSDTNLLREIPTDPNRPREPRPVSNKIMHFVMQEHAYALQNKPVPDVLPASESPNDMSTANVADAYLRWLTDVNVGDFDEELSDAAYWAIIAGEGYLKWTYDPDEGRPTFASVSPLDIYVDPYAPSFKRARYIAQEQYMDVKDVYQTYGKQVKPTQADPTKAGLLRELGQAPTLDGVVVTELWLKPGTPLAPDGDMIVFTDNEILYEHGKFPYSHGKLPYSQLGCIPIPKTPHYTCATKYLRSPQMELNKYHAQKLMSRGNFANPKWWIPTDLELETDPDDSTGQILRGNSMGGTIRPELISGDLMQDSNDGEWIRDEMMDVVGLHEVSNAQVPGRVEAAKAIEMLKESDTSRLEELERTIKRAVSQGFWQCLMLCKQYVSEEKMVQTYSPEGYPEVHAFKAQDLKPGMRIRVTMGTGLSRSRAARSEAALLLWQNQVITDPEIFANMIDVPTEAISPQRAYDIRLARNENLEIAGDIAVLPNSWDAHAIHIREHNNYRKTYEYRNKSDEVKKKFEFHVQSHEEMELAELEKEARKAMIAEGASLQQPAEDDPSAMVPTEESEESEPTEGSEPATV